LELYYYLLGTYGTIVVKKGKTDTEKIKKGLKLTSSSLEKWKDLFKNFDEKVDELSEIISSLAKIKEYACFISDDFGKKLEERLLKENELNTWNEYFLSFKNKWEDYYSLKLFISVFWMWKNYIDKFIFLWNIWIDILFYLSSSRD
jgi:hypothetical protein